MNLGKDTQKIDMDVLDEIIKLAEGAMVKPFSKKKAAVVAIEGEPESDEMEIEMKGRGEGEEGEEEPSESSFADDDLDALMEEYKRVKGK